MKERYNLLSESIEQEDGGRDGGEAKVQVWLTANCNG